MFFAPQVGHLGGFSMDLVTAGWIQVGHLHLGQIWGGKYSLHDDRI
jgi:hypothetical protein